MVRLLTRAALLLLVAFACAATGVALGANSAPSDSSPDVTVEPAAAPSATDERVGSDIRELAPPPKVTAKAWLVQDAVTEDRKSVV